MRSNSFHSRIQHDMFTVPNVFSLQNGKEDLPVAKLSTILTKHVNAVW